MINHDNETWDIDLEDCFVKGVKPLPKKEKTQEIDNQGILEELKLLDHKLDLAEQALGKMYIICCPDCGYITVYTEEELEKTEVFCPKCKKEAHLFDISTIDIPKIGFVEDAINQMCEQHTEVEPPMDDVYDPDSFEQMYELEMKSSRGVTYEEDVFSQLDEDDAMYDALEQDISEPMPEYSLIELLEFIPNPKVQKKETLKLIKQYKIQLKEFEENRELMCSHCKHIVRIKKSDVAGIHYCAFCGEAY